MKYVKKFGSFLNASFDLSLRKGYNGQQRWSLTDEFDTMKKEIENSLNPEFIKDLENLGNEDRNSMDSGLRKKLENIRNEIKEILEYYQDDFKSLSGLDEDKPSHISIDIEFNDLIKQIESYLFDWGSYGGVSFNQVKKNILDEIDNSKFDLGS